MTINTLTRPPTQERPQDWFLITDGNHVKKVKVFKVTTRHVLTDYKTLSSRTGRRARHNCFPTWLECHVELLRRAVEQVDLADRALAAAQERLADVKAMREPE